MAEKSTLDKMADDFLFCRTENHNFPTYHDHDLVAKRGVLIEFKRSSTCDRCGRKRTQVIDASTFKVDKSQTVYADGYLNDGGRLSKSQVRREQMVRAGYKVRDL